MKYPFSIVEKEFIRLMKNLNRVPKGTPYRYSTKYLSDLVEILGTEEDYRRGADKAEYISNILSETIEYKKDVTDTSTAAAQAFALKKGVCQDFSHILISLLRMDGIAARYIAGLAFCDRETHSWVEYWTGDHWEGIDPANNCLVSDDYIVISQGRDFRDCAIDRGVMFGQYTKQLQLVRSVLT